MTHRHAPVLMARAAACALLLACTGALAQRAGTPFEAHYKAVRAMLEQPEPAMDLASIKLGVDQMIDPKIDKAGTLKQLDRMAAEIRATFPFPANNLTKFKALRDYLYRPPLFSGRAAYAYDLEDDRNPRAKLLPMYLATKKGNCVSMPLLFVILAQKLDIPVAAVAAPAHLYVKFRGDNGQWYGVETTSGGGWADDDWQRKQFPTLTAKAIENGIYLHPLTKRETAAVIAETLLENYEHQKTLAADEARVRLALLILEHHPKDTVAMVHAYLGYRGIRQRLFVDRYAQPSDIPEHLRARYQQVEAGWSYWGNRAKALGYEPTTPAMDAAYRERIRRARAGLQGQ